MHINPLHGVGFSQPASKISITVHVETMSPPLHTQLSFKKGHDNVHISPIHDVELLNLLH